ncbi:MAG: E3 binding domain-containing protein, partial [Gloeobacteraceae cyanobacterium ES-bin-316]|nr:E3 binding domain-containing protein [Ferruginibacter sp.]
MAEVIRMPLLSDTMTEGKIILWNKKVGDEVKADDVLADVETDKATMEVNGYVDGTLLYIGVPAGEAAQVNQIIAIVGKAGEDYKPLLDEGKTTQPDNSTKAETAKPVEDSRDNGIDKKEQPVASNAKSKVELPAGAKEIRMPLLSDTMTEGKIVSWNKAVGDEVKADDVLADVETDKATMEVVGYEEGTLLYIGVEAGKAAQINEIIAIVGKAGTDVTAYVAAEKSGGNQTQPTGSTKAAATEPSALASNETLKENEQPASENGHDGSASNERIKASPLAKKLAADKGIDLKKVNGSGDGGRITKKD